MEYPHERYAKMLIYNKIGYAETLSTKDCFELMLEFVKLEKQLAEEWEKIATDALALKPCSPMLLPIGHWCNSKGHEDVEAEPAQTDTPIPMIIGPCPYECGESHMIPCAPGDKCPCFSKEECEGCGNTHLA